MDAIYIKGFQETLHEHVTSPCVNMGQIAFSRVAALELSAAAQRVCALA